MKGNFLMIKNLLFDFYRLFSSLVYIELMIYYIPFLLSGKPASRLRRVRRRKMANNKIGRQPHSPQFER